MRNKILKALGLSLCVGAAFTFTACDDKFVTNTGNVYYVAPGGTGDGSTKSKATSFEVITNTVQPGDVLLMASGRYEYDYKIGLTQNGSSGKYITVKPAEEGGRVIFDFAGQAFNSNLRGIQIYGDFWYFDSIEICNAGDNGMYISGDYNIIDNCLFYNNSDTGLQLGRTASEDASIETWPSYNLIKNCTSFANYDAPTYGENADGFAAKLTVGYGNVFDGCIAFRNSDDGWDMYAKQDSGCIGTVALYNCVSFENGYLPYQIDRTDAEGNAYKSYNTLNGDGIGFKLGGSTMEGDVVVENCLAFNNKLHGFGDNSNPGFLYLRNSTAFNNCMGLNDDGTVGEGRGIPGTSNKSNNFDLARDTNSYNAYYGLLSYINNQDDFMSDDNGDTADNSYNGDKFRGSIGYSIFQTSYNNGEVYTVFEDYKDSSIYKSASVDTSFYSGETKDDSFISDDDFKSLAPINAMCASVDHLGDLLSLHKELRNADGSVNMGDRVQLKETSDLYKFADGKPVGAVLNKTSYADYVHYDVTDLGNLTDETKVSIQAAYNTLEVLTNEDAVYQDFKLCKFLHGCSVEWESNNTDVIYIDNTEDISVSYSVFSFARIKTPSVNTEVTLKAKISCNGVSKVKEFKLTVRPRIQALGSLTSSSLVDSFKVQMYGTFVAPTIIALDKSSNTESELNPELYTMTTKYEYATSGNSEYYEVDDVYTSVPGVYKVTVTATMKADSTQTAKYTYMVYILDPECEIDLTEDAVVVLNSNGYVVNADLSNVYGYVYSLYSTTKLNNLTVADLIKNENVQKVEITDAKVSAQFEADNTSGVYYGYYAILNHNLSNASTATLYSFEVKNVEVTTKEQFYSLATTGKMDGATSTTTTIFNLANDLDFTGFDWAIKAKSTYQPFSSLFNGNDHKISNLTVIGTSADKNVNVFFKIANGTLMNVNFDNVIVWNKNTDKGQVGIVGELQGGYIYDVHMTNIAARGREGVSALVGIVSGKTNFIDACSLVNPIVYNNTEAATAKGISNLYAVTSAADFGFKNTSVVIKDDTYLTYSITAYTKYAGGIVGNVQKNSDQSFVTLHVTNCFVNAIIGDGHDSGGCMGGIIGRVKDDASTYNIFAEYNYFSGLVLAKGNYNGGIIGSIEAALGNIVATHNYADVVFQLDGDLFNAYQYASEFSDVKVAHKNCSPIIGRATSSTEFGSYLTEKNYGTWQENYATVSHSTSILFDLSGEDDNGEFVLFTPSKSFFENSVGFDVENVWDFDTNTKMLKLRNILHA